jgi:hypothetical protein
MSFFNSFNLEGSMIKRLYSVHDKDYKPEETSQDKEDRGDGVEAKDAKIKEKMYKDIKARTSFRAKYWPWCIRKNPVTRYALCQCNKKPNRNTKLF